jgi:peptide/nickel transport system permease protein
VFAPLVSRYDPNRAFSHPNPGFDPQLYQESLSDPTVKLKNIAHPEKFIQGDVFDQNEGMSTAHWLGTDPLAHDTWARIVYGARLSLFVGIGGALFACTVGTILGLSSGYFGGWIDDLLMRFTDALFTFPPLILLLLIVQVVDKPNKWWITFALGILGIASVVRIVRSTVLSAREEVYVLAAQSIGASDLRIMLRHILPNILAAVIVVFSISIGGYILAEAGLAFIGLGDPVAISWGKMLDQGRQYGVSAPLFAFWVGMAITLSVLGFNLAGDAVRDMFDPRLRGRGGRPGF